MFAAVAAVIGFSRLLMAASEGSSLHWLRKQFSFVDSSSFVLHDANILPDLLSTSSCGGPAVLLIDRHILFIAMRPNAGAHDRHSPLSGMGDKYCPSASGDSSLFLPHLLFLPLQIGIIVYEPHLFPSRPLS